MPQTKYNSSIQPHISIYRHACTNVKKKERKKRKKPCTDGLMCVCVCVQCDCLLRGTRVAVLTRMLTCLLCLCSVLHAVYARLLYICTAIYNVCYATISRLRYTYLSVSRISSGMLLLLVLLLLSWLLLLLLLFVFLVSFVADFLHCNCSTASIKSQI